MNRCPTSNRRFLPYALVAIAFGAYVVIFASYNEQLGTGVASLATIPVVVAGWYFGIRGGIGIAVLTIGISVVMQSSVGHSPSALAAEPGNILRMISLLLVAIVTGKLSDITTERISAIQRLEQFERQSRTHNKFLELLNGITSRALEADELKSTLHILVEQFAVLFEADDCFFARWEEATARTIPVVAYGSFHDRYPEMRFEPGEQTLTSSIMKEGRTIAIPDTKDSSYISSKIASVFHSASMLGLPLIVQESKLGAIILGYKKPQVFDAHEITRAEIAAEQMAVVLFKSQLLENAQNRVIELTALHDVALAAIEADSEDQLIIRATEIIGKNLFPDNFGILLLDENAGVLSVHPSYRFLTPEVMHMVDVPLGQGITGQVAMTGKSQRLGNVKYDENYLLVDQRTISELCVPIKLQERVLGVINAESIKRDAFTRNDERLLITLAGQLATAIEQLRKAQTERKWLDQLTHSNELIYALAHSTTHIEKAITPDEIIRVLGTELKKIQVTCLIALHDPDRRTLTISHTTVEPAVINRLDELTSHPLINSTIPFDRINSALGEKKNLTDAAHVSEPEMEFRALLGGQGSEGLSEILPAMGITPSIRPLRMPLVLEDSLLGILWVWGETITRSDIPIMSIFAKQIGISLERARLFQEVQNLALADPLTGLHNRRSFFELGRIEFSRAERFNRPFCCLMLDLDHFKQINDTHGHHAGDIVLQDFAKLCLDSVRDIDLVGRYGGEELIILMPETDLETGIRVAERLRSVTCEKQIRLNDHTLNVTVSIGIATKDENTRELETLIARADQAMYIAKHKGRNRVAVGK